MLLLYKPNYKYLDLYNLSFFSLLLMSCLHIYLKNQPFYLYITSMAPAIFPSCIVLFCFVLFSTILVQLTYKPAISSIFIKQNKNKNLLDIISPYFNSPFRYSLRDLDSLTVLSSELIFLASSTDLTYLITPSRVFLHLVLPIPNHSSLMFSYHLIAKH